MADIKISELLSAVTPLDGTETLPIVQNGNTVKATSQDIASLYSLGYTAENVANKSTDSSFAGANDLRYPSQLAVKTYVDNTLVNAGWGLSGNSGTTSANFIGTTNAQDFVLKSNNNEYLRLQSSGGILSSKNIQIYNVSNSQFYASTSSNGYAIIGASASDKGYLGLNNGSGSVLLKANNLSGNKALQLPDANGILVATVNGVAPDLAGNVTVSSGWSLSGNSGTTSANFIGTTDAQDVVIKANNSEFLRLSTSGTFVDHILGNRNIAVIRSNNSKIFSFCNTNSSYVQIAADTTDKASILLYNSSGSAKIQGTNLTSARTLQLPNSSGTLVTSVNGTAPDTSGNVTISAGGWGLTGNAGTTAGTDFIGTTDDVDFVIKRNNLTRFKVTTPSSGAYQSLIGVGGLTVYSSAYDFGSTYPLIELDPEQERIKIKNNAGKSVFIYADLITDPRSLSLPDKSGTLATEDYLVYTALITQSGGTVTATVLQNTLGTTINWTIPTNGTLRGTAASGNPFTANKTWVSSGSYNNAGSPYMVTGVASTFAPWVTLEFYLYDGTKTGTPTIFNYSLEIRVYP